MKKYGFIYWCVCIVIAGLLTGCGAAESNEVEPVEDKTTDADQDSDMGELTVTYKNNELNETRESGPIKLSVKGITVGELKVSEENKDIFDNKDIVTLVTIDIALENNSDESIWFAPNKAIITTDNGEEVEADMLISGLIGDPFIGKGKKEGDIIFILDTPAEEISQLNMVIEGAEDEESEKVGDLIEMTFDVK